MTGTNVLPEDTALAEEIARRIGWPKPEECPYLWDFKTIIAAHRPPLVARLVEENARMRAALEPFVAMLGSYKMAAPSSMTVDEARSRGGVICEAIPTEHFIRGRAALSPAPAIDLGNIERALEKSRGANVIRAHDTQRPESWQVQYQAIVDEIDAALASVREVRNAQ